MKSRGGVLAVAHEIAFDDACVGGDHDLSASIAAFHVHGTPSGVVPQVRREEAHFARSSYLKPFFARRVGFDLGHRTI